ncbi:sugar O-acetyltransferase [Aliirhizobium terrae]|uniref:sugar O-acetyltransferase n=1 Tax=Terrirhizobium terrae TaxID=2926709 RepID=UPI002576F0D4|nr:sugar O-acetyltransferase [Rhizobium sp. CC-CFT758]WJH39808.1 sugar O-acetyltransferase [Rhizobium sp. CC-CFT758]
MDELEKAARGLLYGANHDPAVLEKRMAAKRILHKLNGLSPDEGTERAALIRSLMGRIGKNFVFDGAVYCDYGFNIEIGDNFYANVNLIILDGAKVTIGDNVFIAPNVGIYTAGHPLDAIRRNAGLEYALPITIGNNVWIGGGVSIMPGVTIGDGAVIGGGAVVTRDIPPDVVAAGNPARVIREITEEDGRRESFGRK